MALIVLHTPEERLVGSAVVDALRDAVDSCGSAVLFVPSFARALEAQRALAGRPGLSLSVATTTPSAWVRERWEVWGDGRAIADATVLAILSRMAVDQASPDERGPIEPSPGIVDLLSRLVGQALPWLPLASDGSVREGECVSAGLTVAETRLVGLAGKVGQALCSHGYASMSEVSSLVPRALGRAGASVPPVVVAGFSWMSRSERELLQALGRLTTVTFVSTEFEGPASDQVRRLVGLLEARDEGRVEAGDAVRRHPELTALLSDIFGREVLAPVAASPVELLLPSGPVAEAETVARRVVELAEMAKADVATPSAVPPIVVAVPDMGRAWRELVPKLVSRGVRVRVQGMSPLSSDEATQAFFSYARVVAHLSELATTWPDPVQGPEGPVARLGDMDWWPPRELVDFLLSDISHVGTSKAWRLDALWRGNRLLTPARVLEMLQSERDTSAPVARATAELLRGRIGTAASKLLAPYVEAMGDEAAHEGADQARAALQAVLQLAGTLRELGITSDPSVEGALGLRELVELAEWASCGGRVVGRQDVGPASQEPQVLVLGTNQACELPPGSAYALVACGLTTAEQPVRSSDDLLHALFEALGVEPALDPMAQARSAFRSLVAVPRVRLVLERALHDVDAKPTYPSVMLSELLATYGMSSTAEFDDLPLPHTQRPETTLASNLSPVGLTPAPVATDEPSPSGSLTEAVRELVFVPQAGSDRLPGGKPVLSASQVESYLDCPYKWFSLRRLRLGQVDAGHTGMEMGTFAHRVLEVTHRELLAGALEAENPGVSREELLEAIERNPVRHVAGSRVTPETLDVARSVLGEEFDLHMRHMYMERRPRQAQQLLVAHDSFERAQEERLRQDLLSSLEYQTRILQGFEPRLFEWGFGRHDQLVEYAGAYFTGTVDRIDVSPHGTAVIIDYKHKSPVGFAAEYDALQEGVLEGTLLPRRVQSLIYAQVVRRAFEGRLRLVGTVYLSTRSPHALAGAADDNVADLVFGRLSSRRAPQVCVPAASDGSSGMDELLDRTEELVAEQVARMMAGDVEARPRDKHSCDFCPVTQCERRVAR